MQPKDRTISRPDVYRNAFAQHRTATKLHTEANNNFKTATKGLKVAESDLRYCCEKYLKPDGAPYFL